MRCTECGDSYHEAEGHVCDPRQARRNSNEHEARMDPAVEAELLEKVQRLFADPSTVALVHAMLVNAYLRGRKDALSFALSCKAAA